MEKINKEKETNILSPINLANTIPTKRNRRDLIQSYYTSINLDNGCDGDVKCNYRPLSNVEDLINKSFTLSELYLTNQLEQALVKSKLGKVKICDYDNTMNIHYWVTHLSIFYQDIVSYSNTCDCITDAILNKFKDKYSLDCILENINCKKDKLALLFNQIYNIFIKSIPKCDDKVSLEWDDEYYCVCIAEELPPITINNINPTYRTLEIDWTHQATGLLYLVEVREFDTQELVFSSITSNFSIVASGLRPDFEYQVTISASNCNSQVSVTQNQNTLPVWITVNVIDNRQDQLDTEYQVSFIGTRQLLENEEFVLDFEYLNLFQEELDVLIPNKYNYWSKIDINTIDTQEILTHNIQDSRITKLNNYLGLFTQGRVRISPLINTTINLYLDEISYEMDQYLCNVNDLIYTHFTTYNSEESISIKLPQSTTLIQNQINLNSSTLFISEGSVQEVLDNISQPNSALCCNDPELTPLNLNITNIGIDTFTVNFTPQVGTGTLTIYQPKGQAIVFSGNIDVTSGIFNVAQSVGLIGGTQYVVTLDVTNCTGLVTGTQTINTEAPVYTNIILPEELSNVRIQYLTETQEATNTGLNRFAVPQGVNVVVTWGIVNLDTGLPDDGSINIESGSHSFPKRITNVTINGVNNSGSLVSGMPDENGVVKARQHSFVMPSTDYDIVIEFEQIQVVDFDFENPVCTDNTQNGQTVATVKDITDTYQGTQATPTGRALLQNNSLVSPNISSFDGDNHGYIISPSFPITLKNVFTVGKMNALPTAITTSYWRVAKLDHSSSFNNRHYTPIWAFGNSRGNGVGAHPTAWENTFGYHTPANVAPIFRINYPTPAFDMASNVGERLIYSFGFNNGSHLLCNSIEYIWDKNSFVASTGGRQFSFSNSLLEIGTRQGAGRTEVSRILFTEELTTDEYTIIKNKFEAKY